MNDSAYSETRSGLVGPDSLPAGLPPWTGGEPLAARAADNSGLVDSLMTLLSEAEQRLVADRTGARWSIARARSLLEAQRPAGRDAAEAVPPLKGGLPPRTMRKLEAFVDERLASRIRSGDLTKIAHLSARHFCLAFGQSFGQSPHAYILGRRIERAKQLMLHTDEPLCRIALDCGFADQSHLNKWFRRLQGVTPSAWRKGQYG